jgi:threonine aldolase
MREAMMRAEVGDDVFGEDPTVNALEERMAELFGHEAGLFCPSGTMTNQIAVHVHTRPGDEVICDEGAHIYRYEGGGVMATSGCSVKLLDSDRGRFTAEQVRAAINDTSAHYLARTRLVNIENTANRGGGSVWDLASVDAIRDVCREHDLALHLDGARIFNALAVTGESAKDWGSRFDTVSICLSKGLGSPVGSVLVGGAKTMAMARRVRKRLGGGMRQAGILAAACHHALDHHLHLLPLDHERARTIADALAENVHVGTILPVETNIIIFKLRDAGMLPTFMDHLAAWHVRAVAIGPGMVRMVTHLDLDDEQIQHVAAAVRNFAP